MTAGTYKAIESPASVDNVEDTLQCIYEASSLSRLLSSMSVDNQMDTDAITEIGNTLVRLLSQPMECAGQVISDAEAVAEKKGGAS